MLPNEQATELMEKAESAARLSYSPYSKFKVGAALLTKKNNIYIGTNIECISYSDTQHAERVAVSKAKMSNEHDYVAIAVWADIDDISPCGGCRQFLIEFNRNLIVIFKDEGKIIQKTVAELLPYQFKEIN